MDRLDIFSILGDLFPRVTAVVLLAGLVFCPRLVEAQMLSAVKEEARRVTVELESVIEPALHRHAGAGAPSRRPDPKARAFVHRR